MPSHRHSRYQYHFECILLIWRIAIVSWLQSVCAVCLIGLTSKDERPVVGEDEELGNWGDWAEVRHSSAGRYWCQLVESRYWTWCAWQKIARFSGNLVTKTVAYSFCITCIFALWSLLLLKQPFSCVRQHLSYDGCLEERWKIVRTVLCWILFWICAQSWAHLDQQFLQFCGLDFVSLDPFHCAYIHLCVFCVDRRENTTGAIYTVEGIKASEMKMSRS